MRPDTREKLRTGSPLILLFAVLAAGIIATGYLSYLNYERRFRIETERRLSAIAELKVSDLVRWRKERLGDAGILFKNASFSALVRNFFRQPADPDTRGLLQAWLDKYKTQFDYDRIFLLDAQCVERISAPETPEPVAAHLLEQAPKILRSDRVTFLDFHRDSPDRPIHLSVLVPILDGGSDRPALGILVLRIDPGKYLYPYINRWPAPSRSAETLLIRRDGNDALYLNELKFRKNTALNLRVPLEKTDVPAVKAALGREGIVEGVDYRGVRVAACVLAVPDSPWFLVARMDSAEAYAPARERLGAMAGLVGALLLGAGMGVGLIWRHQRARFYRAKAQAAEALRESEERMRGALQDSPIVIFSQDKELRYTWICNPHPGFTIEQVLGKTDADLLPAEDAATMTAIKRHVLESGIGTRKEVRTTIGDRAFFYDLNVGPLHDAVGNIVGITCSSMEISERKRMESQREAALEEVRQKTKELQEKNAELEHFSYAVSHDLKSPLVTLRTFLGHLERDLPGGDAARVDKDLGYIRAAADKMDRLLNEILNLSRVGRMTNPPVESPLQAIVKEALDLVAGRIAGRGAQVNLTEEPVLLYGDRARLVEVFQNLADNAVKFMGDQPAPRVEIGVEQSGAEIALFVRDNGIGIDPRNQPKLFGLFEKLDSGMEGDGIGLALVKRIVEVHGGRIWAESAGPGQGATFRFTLAKTRRPTRQGG